MTVIAYKDGIFAYNTGLMQYDSVIGFNEKVVPFGDYVAGATGAVSPYQLRKIIEKMESGTPLVDIKFEADKDGTVFLFNTLTKEFYVATSDQYFVPLINSDPFAIGIAKEMALGAMYAGASALEAVRICQMMHDSCLGKIKVYRISKEQGSLFGRDVA